MRFGESTAVLGPTRPPQGAASRSWALLVASRSRWYYVAEEQLRRHDSRGALDRARHAAGGCSGFYAVLSILIRGVIFKIHCILYYKCNSYSYSYNYYVDRGKTRMSIVVSEQLRSRRKLVGG